MITEQFLQLPGFIEYEGITFELQLISDGNTELRLLYDVHSLSENCIHKTNLDQFGCWPNPFISPGKSYPCGFLYLVEGIKTDDDLIGAMELTKVFLMANKLMPRQPGIAKGQIKLPDDFDEPLEDFKDYE